MYISLWFITVKLTFFKFMPYSLTLVSPETFHMILLPTYRTKKGEFDCEICLQIGSIRST